MIGQEIYCGKKSKKIWNEYGIPSHIQILKKNLNQFVMHISHMHCTSWVAPSAYLPSKCRCCSNDFSFSSFCKVNVKGLLKKNILEDTCMLMYMYSWVATAIVLIVVTVCVTQSFLSYHQFQTFGGFFFFFKCSLFQFHAFAISLYFLNNLFSKILICISFQQQCSLRD